MLHNATLALNLSLKECRPKLIQLNKLKHVKKYRITIGRTSSLFHVKCNLITVSVPDILTEERTSEGK